MGSLLPFLAVDSSDLIRLGNNLDRRSGGSKDLRGVVVRDRDVQSEQHVLMLAGQHLHPHLQSRLIRSLVGEMDFVLTRLGGH